MLKVKLEANGNDVNTVICTFDKLYIKFRCPSFNLVDVVADLMSQLSGNNTQLQMNLFRA